MRLPSTLFFFFFFSFFIKYIYFSLRRTSTLRLFLCSCLFFDDFMTHRPMRWVTKVAHLQCYEHSYHDPARQREGKTTRWDVEREGGGRENTRSPQYLRGCTDPLRLIYWSQTKQFMFFLSFFFPPPAHTFHFFVRMHTKVTVFSAPRRWIGVTERRPALWKPLDYLHAAVLDDKYIRVLIISMFVLLLTVWWQWLVFNDGVIHS